MKISHWLFLLMAMTSSIFAETMYQQRKSQKSPMTNAEHFQGIDLSAGIGYGGLKLITSRGGIKPQSHTNYGADGIAAQLKLGGNYAFCDLWLIGLEAYGQYNNARTTNRFFESTATTSQTSRTFKLNWNFGLDVRLGIAPYASNLLFIYGGPDWGHYDFHYTTTGVDSKYKKFKTGGVVGGGLEQLLSDHWTLRALFDYRWYPSKTLSFSNGEQQTIKARLGTALFMFGYIF